MIKDEKDNGKVTSTHVADVFARTSWAKDWGMRKLKALCSSIISLYRSKSGDGAPRVLREAAPRPVAYVLTADQLMAVFKVVSSGVAEAAEAMDQVFKLLDLVDRDMTKLRKAAIQVRKMRGAKF